MVFLSIDYYSIVYDTGSNLCSCITFFLPSSCWPYYNYRPNSLHRSQHRYWNPSGCHQPLDERKNSSGISNQSGTNRYFHNQNGSRTDCAYSQLHPVFPPDKTTSDPSTSPSSRSLASKLLPQFVLPKFRFPKFSTKLYF